MKVVELHASGMSCTAARRVAGTVARDVQHGRSIAISGAEGFGMSQTSCTGCKSTTDISITYPHGTVRVALRGGGSSSSLGPTTIPSIPAVPAFPTPPPSSSGPVY